MGTTKMTPTIKVQSLGMDEVGIKEVNLEEARRIVEEAYARGSLVVNKSAGEVIDELTPDVEEVIIVDAVGGG